MQFINIENIKSYLFTLYNTFKIYLIIKYRVRINKNKNFIIFYFPVNIYQNNILELVKKIEKKKNNIIFLVYNRYSSSDIKKKKNSMLIDFGYLKFVPFSNFFLSQINLFVSSYVSYVFPPNSKNVYISHDIADAPMVNKNIEKRLFLSLLKTHYIFLSSDVVVKYFQNKFIKYFPSKNIKKPQLINAGYLKLDHVRKKLKNYKYKSNSILIAPTASHQMKKFNVSSELLKIIEGLLKDKKEKIIYRPHPLDLAKKGNIQLINKISHKYKNFSNFTLDLSKSYLQSYSKAKYLITDFSGTAYTFIYSTMKPVIFYSKNEKKLQKSEFRSLMYFKDRKRTGFIVKNVNELIRTNKKISKNYLKIQKKINFLKKERIKYLDKSLNQTYKEILKIIS
jgi:hypothetical protein